MASDKDHSWYHGNITREEADEILKKDPTASDGLFLVKDSNTTPGDFVLSVLDQGETRHFQIRRHGEDAFFSIDDGVVVHGLETLIDYYQDHNLVSVCPLNNFVKKNPPPHEARLHGSTNLLHRATKERNYKVVSELLKYGNRCLEAKNKEGETAVHLATRLGDDAILKILIESGASVNCRDMEGNTPLHYACQNNHLSIARILLESGSANVQVRNTQTDWVPMHEAASRGYLEMVKLLLSFSAPSKPRAKHEKLPEDLAADNGFLECSNYLYSYRAPRPNIKREDFYHGTLDRNEAVALLEASGKNDGQFLVRLSKREYVLTMMCAKQSYHYQIKQKGEFFVIDNGPCLESLEHVIQHYSIMPDGLPSVLISPIKPKPKPPLPNFPPNSFSTLSPRKKQNFSTANHATLPLPSKKKDFSSIVDNNMNQTPSLSPQRNLQSHVFIPKDNLVLKDVLGEGEFGSVYRAILQNHNGVEEYVAVKTLHRPHIPTDKEKFLMEGKVMMGLNHHCVVKFKGLSEGDTLLMVQELVPLGSMLTFLLNNPDSVSPEYELHVWASQIACGMAYLEKQRLVHRDLAARNILLATRHQAKISDFGLSRTLLNEQDYYQATQGGRWPIKWYAPESFNHGTFSSASDVWSFGVTLWEMFSYGLQPYGNKRGADVTQMIEKGERLPKPLRCPIEVHQVMEKCWAYHPRDRPTFSELTEFFSSHTNYENVKHLISEVDISS